MALELERVAEIHTPTKRPDGASGKGKFGEICTGYLVAPGLVLTCRHGVMPNNREEHYPIKARWRNADRIKPQILSQTEVEVAWNNESLDAALLRCKSPVDLPIDNASLYAKMKPTPGQKWNSLGFPNAGQEDFSTGALKTFIDLQGDILKSSDQSEHVFLLGCDYSPVEADGWKGASGAPIFQADGVLVGIARKSLHGFGGQQIQASPLWQMFEDEEFRQLLDQTDPASQKRKQEIGKAIAKYLNKLKENRSELYQDLIILLCNELDGVEDNIVEQLLSSDHSVSLKVVENCFRAACRDEKDELAKEVGLLACYVLAATYRLPQLKGNEGLQHGWLKTVVDAGTGTSYGTELYHASSSNSRARFCKERDIYDMHRGELDLGAFPQAGPDADSKFHCRTLDLTIKDRFSSIKKDDFEKDLDSRLAHRTKIPMSDRGLIDDREWVRTELEYRKKEYREQYYIRYRKPESDEEEKSLSALIAALPEDYGLIVHYLEQRGQMQLERVTYRMLKDMIDAATGNLEHCHKIRGK